LNAPACAWTLAHAAAQLLFGQRRTHFLVEAGGKAGEVPFD